ncbi:protein tipE-like [Penaeus japonicus]|uniref:protein tipE-like n=1 Tax=Penaeus japonicus TaxID=27405 RepID=UPI001C710577|nr:protein tipE-like [Penaeus japonicus]
MEGEEQPEESFAVKLKYYTTLTMGTTACLSSFIFMFLIPWILDPSISTLMANFDPEQVLCRTVRTDHLVSMKNCSWSSCKHGCTTDQYECDQIYVDYMHVPFSEYDEESFEIDEDLWVGRGVPLFINIKACGYPPQTNCSTFADKHGPEGSVFACHYSRADPNMVITEYSWWKEVNSIILALLIPNVLCGFSLGLVTYWWYPGCQKRRCQYQLPPDQEDASSNNADDEDDEEGEHDEERDGAKKGDESDMKNRPQEEEKDRDTSISMPEERV